METHPFPPDVVSTITTTATSALDQSTFRPSQSLDDDLVWVEVVLGLNAGVWHLAQISDLILPSDFPDAEGGVGSLKISFPNSQWKSLEISPLRARLANRALPEDLPPPIDGGGGVPPPSRELPVVGQVVEVLVSDNSDEPPYWAVSRVLQLERASIKVAFVDSSNASREMIVGVGEARQVSQAQPISLVNAQRRRLPIPLYLSQQPWNVAEVDEDEDILDVPIAGEEPWVDRTEALNLFRRIRRTCKVLQLSILRMRSPLEIEIVGEQSECLGAEGILSQEFQQLKSILEFHERRGRRLKLLEERKSRYGGAGLLEFAADDSMIGLIIGKQGENISRVAKTHKVEIRVLPDDSGVRRIRIYGENIEAANRARDELDYSFVDHPVDGHLMAWALAKRGSYLRELTQRTGLHSAWLNEASSTIVLCGLKVAVVAAVGVLHRVEIEGAGALLLPVERFLPSRPTRQPARGRGRRHEGKLG